MRQIKCDRRDCGVVAPLKVLFNGLPDGWVHIERPNQPDADYCGMGCAVIALGADAAEAPFEQPHAAPVN